MSTEEQVDEHMRLRRIHKARESDTSDRLTALTSLEGRHQDQLDKLARARSLLDNLTDDQAAGYRDRARQQLQGEHGDWPPRHLIDLHAARAAWADGHRGVVGDHGRHRSDRTADAS